MDSNDISDSVDEWKILKLGGIDNELRILLSLAELRWVDDLHGANEHLVGNTGRLGLNSFLVWERCINDNTVEVALFNGSSGDLGELGIGIFVST